MISIFKNADSLSKEDTIKEAKKWLKCVETNDCASKNCKDCENRNIVRTPGLIERLLYFCEENNDAAKETL